MPTVSLVMPVHGGGSMLRRCIDRCIKSISELEEIIVVVDGTVDEPDVLKNTAVQQVSLVAQRGPAHARNLGASHARGEILFFVDADVLITQHTIPLLRRFFAEHQAYDAAIGSYCDAPGQRNFLSQYKNLFHHYVHQHAKEEAFTFWTGCGAIRREVFLQLGGFDERYGKASIEDIELGYRMRQSGHRIRLLKDVQVTHLKRWTIISLLRADLFHRAIPWTELILSTRRLDDDLNIDRSSRLKVFIAWLVPLLIIGGFIAPILWIAAVLAALLLLALDSQMLRFFARKRGALFAIAAIPWQWMYYFYSGLGFFIGLMRHLTGYGRTVLPRAPIHSINEAAP